MESPEPAQDQSGAQPSGHDERVWATFCHLAAFAWVFVPTVPLGNILGPLVVWLARRERYPLVDDQGKESLNFQITVSMILVALAALFFVPVMIHMRRYGRPGLGLPEMLPGILVIGILDIVYVIVAAVQANKGIAYRYPIAIRFIR